MLKTGTNRSPAAPDGKVGHKLKEGLTDRSAKFPDASMKCSGGSVNSESTRSETAKTPSSLGPRVA